MGQSKDVLLEIEKEGVYVFHGSPDLIEELEPRQAKTLDKESGEMIQHGEPAVVATPFVEIAVFRAIINSKIRSKDGKHHSAFSCDNGKVMFMYLKKMISQSLIQWNGDLVKN
jgi:hypothetical protein